MAASIFARIGTIKGESQDARHKDEIEVESWSWGVSRTGAAGPGGGGGSGRASFQDLSFTHHLDRASPLLMRACARGEHLKQGTITARRAGRGPQDYLVITMKDVLVTSVSTSAEAEAAVEVVALRFAEVDLEYRPQKADGSLDAGVHFTWNLTTNRES